MPMNVDPEGLYAQLAARAPADDLPARAALELLRISGALERMGVYVVLDAAGEPAHLDWLRIIDDLDHARSERKKGRSTLLDASVLSGDQLCAIEWAASLTAGYPIKLRQIIDQTTNIAGAWLVSALMGARYQHEKVNPDDR